MLLVLEQRHRSDRGPRMSWSWCGYFSGRVAHSQEEVHIQCHLGVEKVPDPGEVITVWSGKMRRVSGRERGEERWGRSWRSGDQAVMLLMTSSGLVPCSESVNLPIPGQPQQAGLNDWPLEAGVGQEARPQQRRQLADQLPSPLSFFSQKHQPEMQLELQPAIVIDHFPLFSATVYWKLPWNYFLSFLISWLKKDRWWLVRI